jgi:hypothetical protein
MSVKPLCDCHGVPMQWNKDRRKAGGFWACVPKARANTTRWNRERGVTALGSPEYLAKKRKARVGYLPAHKRIWAERGKASDYACIECGEPAAEWSLSWRRVDSASLEYDPKTGCPYTLDVTDYDPRCGSHARLYDKDFTRETA